MIKMTDIKKIKKLDPQNMLAGLELLGRQMEETASQYQDMKISDDLKKIKNIVVAGMGGSGLGAHLVKTLYGDKITVPIEIVNDYFLPAYVNENSLVVLCSYSGSTEEILSAMNDARAKKAKIFVIASGGELAKKARAKKIPAIIFTTENNPSDMPRVGAGYMVVSFEILLQKIGVLKREKESLPRLIKVMEKYAARFGVLTETGNFAKKIAGNIGERCVFFTAAEHLSGNAHIMANQMNESGKRFAGYFLIPELNHHLLEGLFFPKSNKKNLLFIFLQSKNYLAKNQKRFEITKNILKKNGVAFLTYETEEKEKDAEAGELLAFGGFLSFYMAIFHNINPSAIPFVDYFKKELKRQ